jgi:hypothetical protein
LIDSEDEDDDRLRDRCCDNYEDDADEDGAETVDRDDEARDEEEFERLPEDIVAPDIREHDYDLPRDGGDLDAAYSRDFSDTATEAFAMRHL